MFITFTSIPSKRFWCVDLTAPLRFLVPEKDYVVSENGDFHFYDP